jgi:hypothetical protein
MSIALVGFALLMVLPALLARRHVGESAARHILPGMSVALGAVITAGGASLPWAPAPLDFGRDAVTALALSAGLYLLGVAMLLRVESQRLALAALVVAVAILGIALRDWLDAVERVGEALSGLAVVALGGLVAGVGALARLVLGHVERR